MADQPQPDFSQTQQFAPGFVQAPPIPGIQSSYPNPQSQFNANLLAAQTADAIAVQNVTSARSTMALAQQNLMYTMHNAMLGTMTAFSDISRRGGSMITAMTPTGRYNDMLAPNQNWALESSFRREMGYGVSKWMGLDPYNSPMSRLIQGRRPEFLTEGEYGSTMKFAHEMRVDQMQKGLASVGISAGAGMAASAMGFGLVAGLTAPLAIGVVGDRMLEAHFAERESLLQSQIKAKTKRVGIGQQYINTDEIAKVHGTFYGEDNPYAARFLGDNALGNAFRPDVQKLKMFQQAQDNGLFAFESLDADSLIKKINQISETVEKFSRIGKVTRDVSMKLMGDLKASGVSGSALNTDFASASMTSSLTGIDLQSLVGMKAQAARQGSYLGYDTFSASSSFENTLSGFAMMQANGLFKQKDIMQMAQAVNANNTRGTQDTLDILMRNGGSMDRAREMIMRSGGGNMAVGMINQDLIQRPAIDLVKTAVDLAIKKGAKSWEAVVSDEAVGTQIKGNPALTQEAYAHYNHLDSLAIETNVRKWVPQVTGDEAETYLPIAELGKRDTRENSRTFFSRGILGSRAARNSISPEANEGIYRTQAFGRMGQQFKEAFGKRSITSMQDLEMLSADMQRMMPVDDMGHFTDEGLDKQSNLLYGGTKFDKRYAHLDLLKMYAPDQYNQAIRMMKAGDAGIGGILDKMETNKISYAGENERAREAYNLLQSTGSTEAFKDAVLAEWKDRGLENKAGGKDTYRRFVTQLQSRMGHMVDENGKEIFDHRVINNLFDKGGISGLFGGKSEETLYSLLSIVEDSGAQSDSKSKYRENRAAKAAGLSLDKYQQAYQAYSGYASKYLNKDGTLKSDYLEMDESSTGRTNVASMSARSDLASILKKMGPEGRKYFESKHLTITPEEMIGRLEDTSNKVSQEAISSWTKPLTGLSSLVAEITDSVRKQAMDMIKAQEDPSGAAIDTLNKILTNIYGVMTGDPHAKKTPEKGKEN